MKVHFFSGFLGSEGDWDFLRPYLRDFEVECHLVEPQSNWSETCAHWIKKYGVGERKSILVGYSLGGRMASQLALGWPELFQGLVAISTHPGLQDETDKHIRVEQDRLWAERFSSGSEENWVELIQSWNSQIVFGNFSPTRLRLETPELRLRSELQLKNLSLGHQADLRERLTRCPLPQTWMTGELDLKFNELAKDLASQSLHKIRHISVADHGHRWPWTVSPSIAGGLIRDSLLNLLKQMEKQ